MAEIRSLRVLATRTRPRLSWSSWLATLVKRLGNRGFRCPNLEAEFQAGCRANGVRFLHTATTVGAACFIAFWLGEVLLGRRGPLDALQCTRLGLTAVFLLAGRLALRHRGWVASHYALVCSVLVAISAVGTAHIARRAQVQASPVEMYWALTTSMVLTTLMMYGFARLRAQIIVGLGMFILGVTLAFAADVPTIHRTDFQRMVIHLGAANVLGYSLYRFAMDRERKLFLQSRRKNHMAQLRRMKEQAEAASRAKTAFLANMSHEIRTPMNGVMGALNMLNDAALSGRDQQFVRSARDSARHLMNVLNEILDFAKLDAQKVRLVMAPFDPRTTVRSACEAFEASAFHKGITVRSQLRGVPPEVCSVTTDESKLRQVLLNLISNAVKFTQQGEVVASLSVTPLAASGMAQLRVEVSDTGIGIPPTAMGSLYQPFYQVETGSNRSHGGTGLGLAICKQIVEEMGGEIEVRSRLGLGTTFALRLSVPCSLTPAGSARAPAVQVAPAPAAEPVVTTPAQLHGEVLLVEDNEVNAFIAQMTLESLGLQVVHARDGEQAVALFRQRAFDLVLMDCEMPVMDGYEAVALIRAIEADDTARPRTPVVALTAHAMSGDREACLSRGMDEHLTKPFDREALATALQRWLTVTP